MGCIVLELLIWLSYSYQALVTFRKNTNYFWQHQQEMPYVVHRYVVSLMTIMETQLQDNTAYKDLLHLVRTKLLVVNVSETYESQGGFREIAKGLHTGIKAIQLKCQFTPSYLSPVRLENFPQPGIVYENEVGLAAPPRRDVPRTSPTSLHTNVSGPEENGGPLVLVRAPTLDNNSDSQSRETLRISDRQEVGELNHLRSMNLQG
jgi:hypothetical protein